MNKIQVFNHEEFGAVRALEIDGEVWFVGKDITDVLGYSDSSKAITQHVDKEDRKPLGYKAYGDLCPTLWTNQNDFSNKIVINESCIYSLIFSSQLPQAKIFKRWVTSEILPSIRKHGGYIAGQETIDDDELLSRALLVAQSRIAEKQAAINNLEKRIELDAPKVKIGEAIMRDDNIDIGYLHLILKDKGYNIGRNNLYKILRNNNLLEIVPPNKNKATDYAVSNGWMIVEQSVFAPGNFYRGINYKTFITKKGRDYILDNIEEWIK